jgi:hypothetical protein
VELSLVHIMLEYPQKIPEIVHADILDCLTNSDIKAFGELLKKSFMNGSDDFDASVLITHLGNGMIREKLMKKMVDEAPYDEEMVERVLSDTIRQMKRKRYREKGKDLEMKLAAAQEMGDHELCNSLLVEIQRLQKEKEALST